MYYQFIKNQQLDRQEKIHPRIHYAVFYYLKHGLRADKPHEAERTAFPEEMNYQHGHAEKTANDGAKAYACNSYHAAKQHRGNDVAAYLESIGKAADKLVAVVVNRVHQGYINRHDKSYKSETAVVLLRIGIYFRRGIVICQKAVLHKKNYQKQYDSCAYSRYNALTEVSVRSLLIKLSHLKGIADGSSYAYYRTHKYHYGKQRGYDIKSRQSRFTEHVTHNNAVGKKHQVFDGHCKACSKHQRFESFFT